MRKMILTLLSALILLSAATPAYAEDAAGQNGSIIDGEELQAGVEAIMAKHGLGESNLSVGYCYAATGDRWYYNTGGWYYAASLYKVPLLMLLSERVTAGELTQQSLINDKSIADIETLVLTYSNNEWAHVLRDYMGGDAVWREQTKKYSAQPDADYSPDFVEYGYINCIFETDVFCELFNNAQQYPNLIECLLPASPGEYFRRSLGGEYEIAMKYGSYEGFHHAAGIVYTPNPFILAVLTGGSVSGYEDVIAETALLFKDYTLKLDAKLAEYRAAEEAAEDERLEQEKAQAEAQRKAEAEAEAQRQAQAEQQTERQEAQKTAQESSELIKKALLIGLPALALISASLLLIIGGKRKRTAARRRSAAAAAASRARSEAERTQARQDRYAPRH